MPLLNEETAAKLRRFQLNAKAIVEGFLVGLHKSPYHGFSVEFSDHREYNTGEPLKNIDWKIVAKTDRYYVKRFEEETNLRCYLLLDQRASMFYQSGASSKVEYAAQLAAALAWLIISQKDAVGLVAFNTKITALLPPKAYRGYWRKSSAYSLNCNPKKEPGFWKISTKPPKQSANAASSSSSQTFWTTPAR